MANFPFLRIAKPNVTLERLLIGSSFLCLLATLLPNDLLSTFSSLFCKDIYQWMARKKKGRRSSSQVLLGSKRKIWLIFVLNSHTENGTLYEKYEKMLKWNNVIKSLQYTIIIIHFFLKFYFFENASKTHKGPSCNRNAQKIFKAGKLLCSFLSIARLESLQNVSRGFKHVDAIPKLVTYCCMFFL